MNQGQNQKDFVLPEGSQKDSLRYKNFDKNIEKAVSIFKTLDKEERVRIISHLDADGICACAILIKALNCDNRNYSISIVQQLNEKILQSLAKEGYKYYFFTDLGSGQIDLINKYLKEKTIFILDHHTPSGTKPNENIMQVNPHLSGIDGGTEISGSGVVYLFTNKLNGKKDMAHIAVIGSIGDVQENNGFQKLNKDILKIAVEEGKITVKKGLRIFGMQTKPLHKTLEYCTDPFIPGVSGSESGSIQFLNQIGINPRTTKGWKKMVHLTDKEVQTLIAGIIVRRIDEDNPDDVIGNIYLLNNEKEESPLKDAKEFATLLNSCGRLNKASIGIGVCLNDESAKRKALANSFAYKKEIVKAMNWYNENKNSKDILTNEGFIIINAKENILVSMAGTVASILSKSNNIKDRTFILSLARNIIDETTKASLRISGRNNDKDLRKIIDTITSGIEGAEAGGHKAAAGAIIPTEKEEEFIQEAKRILNLYSNGRKY
jgi:single-stranded-DNA-specific exonuclease